MTELLALSEPALQRKLQLLAARSDLIHSLQRVLKLKIQKQHLNVQHIKLTADLYSFLITCCDSAAARRQNGLSLVSNSIRWEEDRVTRASRRDKDGCNCVLVSR